MKKINKKPFTLIGLIVVITVIGILVLLDVPRFIGNTQKAELSRIQNDIKVMEQEIETEFINKDDDFDNWKNNNKDFNQLIQEGKLFEKDGVAKKVESIGETCKVIPEKYKDKINTKLKGEFYANNSGKVYYEHSKPLGGIPTEPREEAPEYSDEEIQGLITEGYIPVATTEDLNNIRSGSLRMYGEGTKWEKEYTGGLDKKYVQVANIDLSVYSEEGWESIGSYTNDTNKIPFTGTYDGNGYKITGLTINRPETDYVGLFGYTEGATISNVSLENIKIIGKHYLGGLVGKAEDSAIENSYATGSVTGDWYLGGLVGLASKSTIEKSYATGSVTGAVTGTYAGGLVGRAESGTTISNSYSASSVYGFIDDMGGVGNVSSGTIENSYTEGLVRGRDNVGGLVGWVTFSTTISNSYAIGSVKGGYVDVGGLVGRVDDSTVTNSYWDTETTLQEESAGGKGKSTKDMKLKGTYADWDFVNVWEIDEGNDYPKLR